MRRPMVAGLKPLEILAPVRPAEPGDLQEELEGIPLGAFHE
jgi:hypothetical protein